jgi:hypothetical protein
MGIGTKPGVYSIRDIAAEMEDVFKGCSIDTPYTMGSSTVAEVKFDEYEIRVIRTGGGVASQAFNFRFLQKIMPPGKRSPIKFLHKDLRTTDPKELIRAIRGAKEYLLGVVQSINRALKRKPVSQVRGVEDLLGG